MLETLTAIQIKTLLLLLTRQKKKKTNTWKHPPKFQHVANINKETEDA